jgi:hypothetical protein
MFRISVKRSWAPGDGLNMEEFKTRLVCDRGKRATISFAVQFLHYSCERRGYQAENVRNGG